MKRTVVVLFGPPGAGKTTVAHQSSLQVFDRDDPQWDSEKGFTQALADLARHPTAQAVVIRTGATSSARAKAVELVAATHSYLLTAEPAELVRRITARGRADKVATIAGVRRWFDRFDRQDQVQIFPGWNLIHSPSLGVMSEDW